LKDAVPEGSLDTCISDGQQIESTIIDAVTNLEKATFDGIKTGLNEIGSAVKLMPSMLKDCTSVKNDLEILAKMAEIFSHPLSLIWQVGKSLIVNGSDIFDKISQAITAYKTANSSSLARTLAKLSAKSSSRAHRLVMSQS